MTNTFMTYTRNNGGRVLLLFLLFLLACYQFVIAGFPIFAIICLSPLLVLTIYIFFKWRMTAFWMLFVINYFLQMHDSPLPKGIPMSSNENLSALDYGFETGHPFYKIINDNDSAFLEDYFLKKGMLTYTVDPDDSRVYHYTAARGREECQKAKSSACV